MMSEQQKMDSERAAFEAAMAEVAKEHAYGYAGILFYRDQTGAYGQTWVDSAWIGWQARASLPVGVPDGYALVPVEPTPEMLRAGVEVGVGAYPIYRAMLAAAPAAQPAADLPREIEMMVRALEEGEWAEHVGQTELGSRLESAITGLINRYDTVRKLEFQGHLKACADEVSAWPAWKRECLKPAAEQSAPGEAEEVEVAGSLIDGEFYHCEQNGVKNCPLMTVAQHKRIVSQFAAQLREVNNLADQWAEKNRQLAARDAGEVRVPGLSAKEREDLMEFHEAVCCDAGHRIEKDGMRRLAEIGAVESVGFGKHRLTEFGVYLLAQREQRGGE